jgi:hypothetical protein
MQMFKHREKRLLKCFLEAASDTTLPNKTAKIQYQ